MGEVWAGGVAGEGVSGLIGLEVDEALTGISIGVGFEERIIMGDVESSAAEPAPRIG
jgi:hypothetical protein